MRPPRKKPGQAKRPRTLNGALLDCRWAAELLGISEKTLRARVARRLVPYKRFGGRVVFVRADLCAYVEALEGCRLDEALANVRARRGE